jgi:hypothetical protein
MTNRDLIKIASIAGFTVHQSKLSVYLNHGGNHSNSLTDESLLLICGLLGIELELKASSVNLTVENIQKHYDLYFPKMRFPKYKNVSENLIKYYREKNMLLG